MRAMMFAHDMLLAGSADVDRRRRHGEHDQRAAPDVRAQGRQLRRRRAATTTWRSTAWKTPTSAARRWACSPRTASPSTSSRREAQDQFAIASTERAQEGQRGRQLRLGDRAGHACRARAATPSIKHRRAAVQGQARQDPGPEARVQEGRHDHRRHLVEHLRRRRRAGADARVAPRRSSAPKPIARIVGHAVHAQAPDWFTTAPVGAIEKVLTEDRLGGQGRRPVGGQRGLRRGDDGGDGRVQAAARDRQRARRRLSRSATRSAPAARASSSRCSARCASAARSAASRRCASAAARRRRWRSSCSDGAAQALRCSARTRLGAVRGRRSSSLNATPGVDMLLTRDAHAARRRARPASPPRSASCAGCVVHALAAAFGLAALLARIGDGVHASSSGRAPPTWLWLGARHAARAPGAAATPAARGRSRRRPGPRPGRLPRRAC